jgi:hypothetical protein
VRRGGAASVAVTAAAVVVSIALLLVTALAGLRSPTLTAEVASSLADEPAVQALVADALVDQIFDDAERRLGPAASLLLPLLRAPVEQFVTTTVASPAGRAALTSALTDTVSQLTVPGPTVIDLGAAVDAAIADAPPQLAETLRALLADRELGRIVLGGDAEDAREVPSGTIAGIPSGAMVSLVLLAAVALLTAVGVRRAGVILVVIGLPAAVLLWLAPEVAAGLLDPGAADGEVLTGLAPLLVEGIGTLLGPVRWVATAMAALGALLVGVSQVAPTVGSASDGVEPLGGDQQGEDRGGHGQDPS